MTINTGVGGSTKAVRNKAHSNLGLLLFSASSFLRKKYGSARDLNDAEFLSLFDIPEVNERIDNGFNIKATAALLNHFKERVEDGWLNPPEQLIDLAFDVRSASDAELIARAELVLDYDLEWSGIPPEINEVGEIDWQRNILQNREWLFRINRHGWWTLLGLAYQRTGDERFAIPVFGHKLIERIDQIAAQIIFQIHLIQPVEQDERLAAFERIFDKRFGAGDAAHFWRAGDVVEDVFGRI